MSGGTAAAANRVAGQVLVASLEAMGVCGYVVSPGSRSTPLVMALAAQVAAARVLVKLDERSAGFAALGWAKATGRPAVLVCTSGTAAANYLPAVIEAKESAVPLVVMTADRPPRLRYCHAGQTIDQLKLYGSAAVWFAELPTPHAGQPMPVRALREAVRTACECAVQHGGAAHLNVPFDEPLWDAEAAGLDAAALAALVAGLAATAPQVPPIEIDNWLAGRQRILMLGGAVGCALAETHVQALARLAEARGWPVLADAVSPLRYVACRTRITAYEWIARSDAAWAALAPEAVICVGEPPVSKALRARLAALDVPLLQLAALATGFNPLQGRVTTVRGAAVLGDGAANLAQQAAGSAAAQDYMAQWQAADTRALAARATVWDAQAAHCFEGDHWRALGAHLRAQSGAARRPLFIANSLALRDAEWFMGDGGAGHWPYSLRGANGIDGTLSVLAGIARGSGQPCYAVCGDLAFLHDSAGLADWNGCASASVGLCVVCFDNGGGGIFSLLPIARADAAAFERYFRTPQAVDIAALVAAYGGKYQRVCEPAALAAALDAWDGMGLTVLHVPIENALAVAKRRSLLQVSV